MRRFSILAIMCLAVSISGCGQRDSLNIHVEALRQREPGYKGELIKDCIAWLKREPASEQEAKARLLKTSVQRMPPLFCMRLVNAIERGTMNERDIAVAGFRYPSPALVNILKGR